MAVERRVLLERLRDGLLADFEDSDARTRPVISKELRAVIAELESLPGVEVSSVDDLTRRRAQRLAEAAG